jgi:hypothetical protein
MSKVYIPHLYTKYDPLSGRNVASIDLSEATRFGTLVPVTSGEIHVPTAQEVLFKTIDESFEEDDYLLAIGDPFMIGAALAYASDKCGSVNVLRWDRHRKEYDTVEFHL